MLSLRYAGDMDPRFLSLGDADAQGTVDISRDFSDRIRLRRAGR